MLSELAQMLNTLPLMVVLILVLMEYALWVSKGGKQFMNRILVLILVLMEYALWVFVYWLILCYL